MNTTDADILNLIHSDWDLSIDPWDDPKPQNDFLIEAYNQEPWLLPSVKLDDKDQLPKNQKGIYFAYQGKNVLYIGKTKDANGFYGRWVNHHVADILKECQKALGEPVRIAYWSIKDSSNLTKIEDYLIRLRQPIFNKATASKELKQLAINYLKPNLLGTVDIDFQQFDSKLEALSTDVNSDLLDVASWTANNTTDLRLTENRIQSIEILITKLVLGSIFIFCTVGPILRLHLLDPTPHPTHTQQENINQ